MIRELRTHINVRSVQRLHLGIACEFLHLLHSCEVYVTACVCFYVCESEEGVCDVKPRQALLWSKFRLLSGGNG